MREPINLEKQKDLESKNGKKAISMREVLKKDIEMVMVFILGHQEKLLEGAGN